MWAVLTKGVVVNFCEVILNLDQWFRCLKYLSRAQVAMLFGGTVPFGQFW